MGGSGWNRPIHMTLQGGLKKLVLTNGDQYSDRDNPRCTTDQPSSEGDIEMFEVQDLPPLDRHLSSLMWVEVGDQPPLFADDRDMGTAPRYTSDGCHKVAGADGDCVTSVTEFRELGGDERHISMGCGRVDRIVIPVRCRLLPSRHQ